MDHNGALFEDLVHLSIKNKDVLRHGYAPTCEVIANYCARSTAALPANLGGIRPPTLPLVGKSEPLHPLYPLDYCCRRNIGTAVITGLFNIEMSLHCYAREVLRCVYSKVFAFSPKVCPIFC